jgi:hypothetical protein
MTTRRPSDFEPWEDAAFALCGETRCPSPDMLVPALEGTLDEPALTRVRSHVAACAVCRELTAALEAAAAAGPTLDERARLDAARPQRTPRASRPLWWPAAIAATAILIVGIFWTSRFTEFRSMSVPDATRVAVGTEAPRQFVLPLEAPYVDLPEAPIVLRGGGTDPFVAALIDAAAPLRRREYGVAAGEMAALRRKYPDRPHPAYYEGVSLLLSGKTTEAIEPLEQARRLSEPRTALHGEASWYLAVAFERLGRRADAVATLAELCGSGGPMDETACLALHKLTTQTIGRVLDAVPMVGGCFAVSLLPGSDPS